MSDRGLWASTKRIVGPALPAVRLGAHVGHGVQRLATDSALRGVRGFPRRVEDLTAEVLSRVMNRNVESVSVIDGEAGTSSRARIALTGEDVPDSVFVKLPAATAAPEKSGGGGEFGWLFAPSDDPANLLTPALMRMSARKLADRTPIPAGAGSFIWENYQAVTAVVDRGTHTVLHGDSHPGNTYFRDGRAGLLDWQVVRRGHPARDLTYTLVLGLPTAERQAAQHDLLEVYRRALAASGGSEFDREELFTRYRQAAAYAYVSPLTTAALGGMQAEAIAFEGLERAVNALDDLETVAALRESL